MSNEEEEGNRPLISNEVINVLSSVRKEIGVIYHDLQNPLSIISGNAELLQEMDRVAPMEEEFRQPIQDILLATERLSGAVERLVQLQDRIPVGD